MRGTLTRLVAGARQTLLYLPPGYQEEPDRRYPVLYANDGDEAETIAPKVLEGLESAFEKGTAAPFLWAAVTPAKRNDEYTPWPAPGLSKKSPAFAGRGTQYLTFLEHTLKPRIDRQFRTHPEPGHTGLMGYSLGGLLALYALFVTGTFGCIASLSGSLWYDGLVPFVQGRPPQNADALVYLSLGKGEGKSRNGRMAAVAENTRTVRSALTAALKDPPLFVEHQGGHFTDIEGRFLDALLWFGRVQKPV